MNCMSSLPAAIAKTAAVLFSTCLFVRVCVKKPKMVQGHFCSVDHNISDCEYFVSVYLFVCLSVCLFVALSQR